VVTLCTIRLNEKKFYILSARCISFVLFSKQTAIISIYNNGSHSVLCGSREIHDRFLRELWIHISNGYFELDVHESVHRDIIMNTTNEKQLYKLIHYS
jgi:hypothetical protein